MRKKILVVDDEPGICRLLEDELIIEGYDVMIAGDGCEALQSLSRGPDLILLDVNMPGLDGYSVCERIRDYISCPILFLTARSQEQDCIRGFRAGADDYITKPFHIDELLERIAAHLRREERRRENGTVYMSGDLIIDVTGARVLREKHTDEREHISNFRGVCKQDSNESVIDLHLTSTEFKIVELLLLHKGQVFDKERIYEETRGYDGEADASIITEHIRRIRGKLGRMENGQDYIQTVWGVGYKWIG